MLWEPVIFEPFITFSTIDLDLQSFILRSAMPWLRRLVPGFSMWWSKFNPRSGHVGLMVSEMAMQRIFYQVLLSPASCHSTNCSIFNSHLRTDMTRSSYWQHHYITRFKENLHQAQCDIWKFCAASMLLVTFYKITTREGEYFHTKLQGSMRSSCLGIEFFQY
jgi:hypothetical protein